MSDCRSAAFSVDDLRSSVHLHGLQSLPRLPAHGLRSEHDQRRVRVRLPGHLPADEVRIHRAQRFDKRERQRDDLLRRKDMKLISWHRNESTEAENAKARRAFETVLILAVKQPDTERYRHFSYQVNDLQGVNHNDSAAMEKLVRARSVRSLASDCFSLQGQSVCRDVLRRSAALRVRSESNDSSE